MIYSRSEALLAAKVLFGCLYADMAKQELPVHPLTGQQAEKTIEELMSVPPDIVKLAQPIYE